MITADTLKVLSSYSPQYLTKAAQLSGYKGPNFTACKFLGITNGGQFCYNVVFGSPDFKGTDSTKVYITYNQAADQVIADMA
jgi:hypothetical protein